MVELKRKESPEADKPEVTLRRKEEATPPKVTLKRKTEEQPQQPEGNGGRSKLWLILLLLFLLLVVGLVYFFFGKDESTTSPRQTETLSPVEQSMPVVADTTVATDTLPAPMQETPVESQAISSSDSIEEMAKRVIRGDFGNGERRRSELGVQYQSIQDRVNQLYREGQVVR